MKNQQAGYFIVSEKGTILDADKTVAVLLGVSKCFLVGKPFSIFISKENQYIFYTYCFNNSCQKYRFEFVRNDGSKFHAGAECSRDSQYRRFQIAITDIN